MLWVKCYCLGQLVLSINYRIYFLHVTRMMPRKLCCLILYSYFYSNCKLECIFNYRFQFEPTTQPSITTIVTTIATTLKLNRYFNAYCELYGSVMIKSTLNLSSGVRIVYRLAPRYPLLLKIWVFATSRVSAVTGFSSCHVMFSGQPRFKRQ